MIKQIMERQISEEVHDRYSREIFNARMKSSRWPLTKEEKTRMEYEDDRAGEDK